MAKITPQQAGGVNVVAFLDMLAWSEGTDNGRQTTKERGYDVIVGGQLFKNYADHPRVLVDLPKLKVQSTAAGRYQPASSRRHSIRTATRSGQEDRSEPHSHRRGCLRPVVRCHGRRWLDLAQ